MIVESGNVDTEYRLWCARRDLKSADRSRRDRALKLIDHLANEETRQCWVPGLGRSQVRSGIAGGVRRFGSFFSGVLQELQPNLGIVYDGTLTGSGSTPPAITLSGSLTGRPVPIQVTCTFAGALGVWQGAVSYDEGATIAQTFTSAATVALNGFGSGVTLNIASGSAATNNVWVAVTNQLNDLSGNAVHAVQATQSRKPIITKGANGRIGVKSDGVNHFMTYTLALPSPSVVPTFFWCIARILSTANNNWVISSDSIGSGLLCYLVLNGATTAFLHNGASVSGVATVVNTWYRIEQSYSNTLADYNKIGSTSATGAIAGNNPPSSSRGFLGLPGATNISNFEVLCSLTLNNKPTTTQLANADAAVTAEYGGSVSV